VSGRLPVWERLQATDRRRLVVRPVQRLTRDTLRVEDGDLPEVEGATVFDAWRDGAAYVLRAARIDDVRVSTYLVRAARLDIGASDGRLEALLGTPMAVSAEGELERLACACRGISADVVYRAIGSGWTTLEQLKRATRVTFGVCQGRRCVPWLAERLEVQLDDPRAGITPRPPLVPVPASVLAAFARAG
jgi:bacterioferritin-associated ferredoxin